MGGKWEKVAPDLELSDPFLLVNLKKSKLDVYFQSQPGTALRERVQVWSYCEVILLSLQVIKPAFGKQPLCPAPYHADNRRDSHACPDDIYDFHFLTLFILE